MQVVEPKVRLIGETRIREAEIIDYLDEVGGQAWYERVFPDILDGHTSEGEALVEFAARGCYRSFVPGLNPNVTKVREDTEDYFGNILTSRHGSVLEQGWFVFHLQDVSRVFTHELVRHRVGTAISQESMRFVRLTDIPFWFPEWAKADPELIERGTALLEDLERFQVWMADHFGLDDEGVPFAEKKHKTSFMRRFAPDGVATSMTWGCNFRTLRHVIEMRTSPAAEEEIALVFDQVADVVCKEIPYVMQDFTYRGDDGWVPENRSV